MAVVTIIGAGMMGSALAFPARENGNQVRLVGTHLDREIIETCVKTSRHPKFTRDFPEGVAFYQIAQVEEAIAGKDLKKIAQADVAFHDIIVKATRNSRLVQMVNNLSEQMYRYRFEYIKDESKHNSLMDEHRIIFESLKKGDKETACKTAKLHIDNQEISVMEQIKKERSRR
jgi:DNA-binding FadR family transcriptional regulator